MSFKNLSNDDQRAFAKRCVLRRAAHTIWERRAILPATVRILIVADRPGPKAPQTDHDHHTPFYSKIHSGGFLNAELVIAGIPESKLMFVNSASWNGIPTDPAILSARSWEQVISLGGNARKWLLKNGVEPTVHCDHPQYHKRFKFAEPYPLIEHLKSCT